MLIRFNFFIKNCEKANPTLRR